MDGIFRCGMKITQSTRTALTVSTLWCVIVIIVGSSKLWLQFNVLISVHGFRLLVLHLVIVRCPNNAIAFVMIVFIFLKDDGTIQYLQR